MLPASSIKVGVRARPLGYNELRDGCQSCVGFPGCDEIIIGGTKQFSFDYVFSDQSSQQEIYETAVRDVIGNLFIGYNVTVLAYGQTGSGKTYTMGTNSNSSLINSDTGIIPRTIYDIYKNLENLRENYQVSVKVSFIEVYNEEIFDLLSNNKEIRTIREENSDVKIPGLIEENANTIEDIFKCLLKGSVNRAVGSTAMNETSSRSHAIFTIYFSIIPLSGTNDAITSKLHLVDLAGSERASKTGATGDRFKEGVNINRGLLALGSVISALVEREQIKFRQKHVPYRESKLTRLLQDSLGGNTKTLMLACISPADSSFEETATTLNYAARARMIQNKAVINKVTSAQGEIHQLRAQVTALQAQLRNSNIDTIKPQTTPSIMQTNEIYELNTKIVAMQREKLQILEEYDEEMNKKDDLLKKLWDKIVREDAFKDDVFEELDRYMQEVVLKEDPYELYDEEKTAESIDECESTMKKSDYLRGLREDLQNNVQKLENTEQDLTKFQHYEERNRELEQRIRELEEEKNRKNHHSRQEEVELQLKEARRELNELQNLKREKDRKTEEVNQLKNKIQELKCSIIKVTNDNKKEKATLKKLAADKEKQYKILVNKDRQLQCRLEKQEVQHAKETAVLKKKLESGVANEKRLKELLENKKNFSMNRISRCNTSKNINSQVKLWIRQSLEQAAVISETRQRVEKLFENRRKLMEQMQVLDDVRDYESRSRVELEIKNINDCLSLQQSTMADTNQDLLVTANWNQLRNINECRVAIKFMFKQLVQERVSNVMKDIEMQDLNAKNSYLDDVLIGINNELLKNKKKNDEEVKKALKKRRTTMAPLQPDNNVRPPDNNGQEPTSKRKKHCTSDADSSTNTDTSRRSSRISQTCRCKSGCKSNRCGCLRFNNQCSSKCSCGGLCNGKTSITIPEEIHDIDMSDKENDCNRTFNNIDESIDNDCNKTFVNIEHSSDNDDGDLNVTICNQSFINSDGVPIVRNPFKKQYFPSVSNSDRNV